jgi:hypothetical protein
MMRRRANSTSADANQGPWPEWDALIASADFSDALSAAQRSAGGFDDWPELRQIAESIMSDHGERPGWRFAYLQVLLWLGQLPRMAHGAIIGQPGHVPPGQAHDSGRASDIRHDGGG